MILLIGTGAMSVAYSEVLKDLGKDFVVIGRGEVSSNTFFEKTGIKPFTGGIEYFFRKQSVAEDSKAIIATGTETLMPVLKVVLANGIDKILVEKPAAISIEELLRNENALIPYHQNIFVAYNRRFYASVINAKRLIEEDGGLQSMYFEFTEWAHKITPLEKAKGAKENWFFANSTHVIDLAFFLGGRPKEWNSFSKAGNIPWHNKVNFSGAGVTEKQVLFSYMANWESAGRWGIELLTNVRRLYLKPLEGIMFQDKGTTTPYIYEFNDYLDKTFKPGLYLQTKRFLSNDNSDLCSLKEHFYNTKNIYSKML